MSQQLFTATDAIGFSYEVTWNTVRRNIFSWRLLKPQMPQIGTDKNSEKHLRKSATSVVKEINVLGIEAKVKSFCSIPNILSLLAAG